MPDIQVRHVGSQLQIVLLTMRGFLDTVAAYQLQQQAEELMQGGAYHYILDLEALEYISSAGLETLQTLAQKLQPYQGRIILACVPKKIYHVLDIIGFTTFFSIKNSVWDALQELDNERDSV